MNYKFRLGQLVLIKYKDNVILDTIYSIRLSFPKDVMYRVSGEYGEVAEEYLCEYSESVLLDYLNISLFNHLTAPFLLGDYPVLFEENGIRVGCEWFANTNIDDFIEKYKELKKDCD